MEKIRLTRRFVFDMAHALHGYDGPCKNIHGHTYRLYLSILGPVLYKPESPKDGMVFDFALLKQIVESCILSKYDHALVLSDREDRNLINSISTSYKSLVVMDKQPTCENLLLLFKNLIQKELPSELELVAIRLDETINSFAEWRKEDQV